MTHIATHILHTLLALMSMLPMAARAQGASLYAAEYPLREVRAVWLTTLSGLDWPKTKARDAAGIERQKEELRRILDVYKRANINTVIFQTRIRGAVVYPSQYEPWDACLTGQPGHSPGYDPLEFCIEECHRRGLELHAWIVCTPLGQPKEQASYGAASVTKKRKDLCKMAGGYWFMNPAAEGTADYIAAICREVTARYDIDGISLDYIRYPEPTYRFDDGLGTPGSRSTRRTQSTQRTQSSPTASLSDQRRENITRIVRRVHDEVKALKPWVKLSSSPIGKYRDLTRYSSMGWNCYDAVYQDPQAWLRDNLQDLLFPMMYFKDNHFYPFIFDWRENSHGHPVVPGLGIYFLDPREGRWVLNDVRAQMHTARQSGIGGVAFYRSDFLTRNVKGLLSAACDEFFPYPALSPRMTWQADTIASAAPAWVRYSDRAIEWQRVDSQKEVMYNVYGSTVWPVDVTKAENLIEANVRTTRYELQGRATCCRYFAVTAIDRFGNESAPTQEAEATVRPASRMDVARLVNRSGQQADNCKSKRKANRRAKK